MSFTSPLAEQLAEDVLERFCRYVRVETTAVVDSEDVPSSPGQLELGRMLVAELQELGLTDAQQDEMGFVFAPLPTNQDGPGVPVVGWLAHMDTSPDAPGAGVEPIVHRGYDGSTLTLPKGAVLDPADEHALASRAGHDIVTSQGDTLLGADDKAGVAEIMGAVAYLARHPELPRPNIRVGFTIDEVHARMGDLQKATVSHVFEMREILDPEQQRKFDRKVSEALTGNPRD